MPFTLKVAADAFWLALFAAIIVAGHVALFDFPLDRVLP